MIQKLHGSRSWQLLIATTLILIVPLMADIQGRVGVLRRMHTERRRLSHDLTVIHAEQDALKAQLEFVTSEAYLERAARVDLRITKPGEVALIPMYAYQKQQTAPTPEDAPSSADTAPSVSEQWHRLFFDESTSRDG